LNLLAVVGKEKRVKKLCLSKKKEKEEKEEGILNVGVTVRAKRKGEKSDRRWRKRKDISPPFLVIMKGGGGKGTSTSRFKEGEELTSLPGEKNSFSPNPLEYEGGKKM